MTSSRSLDVVIVAYRSRELLRACLTSLAAHPPSEGLTVHVVDNASGDGTVELVRGEFPDVVLVEAGSNLGFAAASNVGIRAGRRPYVLLLNPDTRVEADTLDSLLELMQNRPDIGIAGCRLVRDDGSDDHAAHRSFPTISSALGHFLGLATPYVAPDVEGPVDAVNGAFMLIRRSALEQVGLLDEGYWMYMEDLDLCYRFRERGWLTWYDPSVSTWHVKHGTSSEVRSRRLTCAFHYGMLRFYRMHYARVRSPVTNTIVYAGIAAKLAASLLRAEVRRSPRLRRARFAATPVHAWPTAALRSFGRTPVGTYAKRFDRRRPRPGPAPTSGNGRSVVLVSHCDFTGNSACHVHAIASRLAARGWSPTMVVPGHVRGARELGPVDFPIVSFGDALPRGVDLVHAFTPRAHVRELVERLGRPYVVHLEDNEHAVQNATRGAGDPDAARAFVGAAAGATVVIERLSELVPEGVPSTVVWPGYDESLVRRGRPRGEVRIDLGITDSTTIVAYTGNAHLANVDDVAELYRAIGRLRAAGEDVVLVKSGWNSVPRRRLPRLGAGIVDLGWIRRARVMELIRAADILVQPGRPGPFDDYRFPSKLPDYLASGNPVVLPRTNIGLELRDGAEALLLDRGSAEEIAAAVERLLRDAELRARLGEEGRAFARRELQWERAVERVESLYAAAIHSPAESA